MPFFICRLMANMDDCLNLRTGANIGEAGQFGVPRILPVRGEEGVAGNAAARQSLHPQLRCRLELSRAVDGQAQRQDENETSGRKTASNLSDLRDVAQRAQLYTKCIRRRVST